MQNGIKAAFIALVVTLGAPVEYVQAQIWVPHDRVSKSKENARGWTLANQASELEWTGAHSTRAEFSVVVARTELAWNRLWAELSRSPPVTFDSDNQIVIAVFLGLRRTGGFAVNISTTEDGPVFYTVNTQAEFSVVVARTELAWNRLWAELSRSPPVTETVNKPAPEAMVTQALTTPYVIRIVPHSDRPVMIQCADAAAGNIYLADTEFEIADAWIRQLWAELQEAQQDNRHLHDIIDEAQRQIEQLQRGQRERCEPCGVLPTEGD